MQRGVLQRNYTGEKTGRVSIHVCHCDLLRGKCTLAGGFRVQLNLLVSATHSIYYLQSISLNPAVLGRKNMNQDKLPLTSTAPLTGFSFNLNPTKTLKNGVSYKKYRQKY